jgi:hypothetical protein
LKTTQQLHDLESEPLARRYHARASDERTLSRYVGGHEKKFKNYQNRKICLNEIKCLHVLILVKRDFFSRPASLR